MTEKEKPRTDGGASQNFNVDSLPRRVLLVNSEELAATLKPALPDTEVITVDPERLGHPLYQAEIVNLCGDDLMVYAPINLYPAYRGDSLAGLGNLGARLASIPMTTANIEKNPAGLLPILAAKDDRQAADDAGFNRMLQEKQAAEKLQGLVKNPTPLPQAEKPAQVGFLFSEVELEHIIWLWYGRIPFGKLSILDGDPGQGKSTIALDIAARLSRGYTMPDSSGGSGPAGVVLLSSEDGPGDTIRPRLEAAGAALDRIRGLDICPDPNGGHPPILPDDLPWIEKAIESVNAKLVIIDPLSSYMGGTNTHRDSEIRGVLSRVADLAKKTGAAILVIRHLNKMSGGNALYRGGGSIGIIGQARSGLLAANDPDSSQDDERHVLASTKCNVAAKSESMAYRIEEACIDHEGQQFKTTKIAWAGTSPHTANSLLTQADDSERGECEEAKEVLGSILEDGPVSAEEVKRQCRGAGVSEATARRAKKERGIVSRKQGMNGGWAWELPETSARRRSQNHEGAQDSYSEHLEHLR